MNQILQKIQLDCHLRIWDGDHITLKYYSSDFLGHARSDILFEKILSKRLELESRIFFNFQWMAQMSIGEFLKFCFNI